MLVGSKNELVRFSFTQVWEPKAMDANSKPKYSVQIIIPKEHTETLDKVRAAIQKALQDGIKKGCFNAAKTKAPEFKMCLRDGDQAAAEKDDGSRDYLKGTMFFNATSPEDQPPGVVDRFAKRIANKDEFYAGCYGIADIGFYPFSPGKGGIGAGLNNVMKREEGERLDGRSSAESAFANQADDEYSDDTIVPQDDLA